MEPPRMRKHKCTGCKEYFHDCIKSNVGWFHSVDCMAGYGLKKSKATSAKQASKDLREFNRRDVRWQDKLTQRAFNRMRVLQELKWFSDHGQNPTCISCGKENMDWCCGHFKTVGAHRELRYNGLNTRLQCNRYCNKGLSGNLSGNKTTRGYTQGLIDRFGSDHAEWVIKTLETNNPVVYSWEELESMREKFNKTIRKLTNES